MPNLVTDLVSLLKNDNRQDVHLVCKGGEQLRVHSLILGARSLFFNNTGRKRGSIGLAEFEYEVVKEFVSFIYSDQIGSNCSSLPDLLKLGHKFQVRGLVEECSRRLVTTVTFENVIELGIFAENYKVDSLSQRCAEIVAENFNIFDAENLDTLPSSLLRKSLAVQSRYSESNCNQVLQRFPLSSPPVRHRSPTSISISTSPTLPVTTSLTSLSKHFKSARSWSVTDRLLGTRAAEGYRLNIAKGHRKNFGLYADPLSPTVEYVKNNALFEEGSPAMFWLHLNTGAMEEFQQQIQRKLNGKVGDGGGQLRPGSLVLARYRVDSQVYRAKVEFTKVEGGKVVLVGVRYIDYGNSAEVKSQEDLYTWDPLLEFVPAQAVLCTFHRAPTSFRAMSFLSLEEQEAFSLLMSSSMQILVHHRLHSVPLLVFRPDVCLLNIPELEVSLKDKEGKDILEKIRQHPSFNKYFGEDFHQVSNYSITPPNVLTESTNSPPLTDLPYASIVPPPLHLMQQPLVQVDLGKDQVVMADIVPRAPTGLDKVSSWLENLVVKTKETLKKEESSDAVLTDDKSKRIKKEILVDIGNKLGNTTESLQRAMKNDFITNNKSLTKKEQEMPQTEANRKTVRGLESSTDGQIHLPQVNSSSQSNLCNSNISCELKPAVLSNNPCERNLLTESILSEAVVSNQGGDHSSSECMASPLTVHFNMCDHCKVQPITGPMFQCSVCADFDLCHPCRQAGTHGHHEMTESPGLESVVRLEEQVVSDNILEFDFMMSYSESPGQFYVHPLTEITARLADLEVELMSGLAGQEQGKGGQRLSLLPGGVYAVFYLEDNLWYRVRLEGVTSGLATLRCIDYGFLLTSVSPSKIRALPPGLARQLKGLAVRCHLALLAPEGGGAWSEEAVKEFRILVDSETVHTATVVPGTNPSLGLLIRRKDNLQVNQHLVEFDLAESSFLANKRTLHKDDVM